MSRHDKQVTPEVVDQLSKPLNVYLYVGPHVEPEKPEVGTMCDRQVRPSPPPRKTNKVTAWKHFGMLVLPIPTVFVDPVGRQPTSSATAVDKYDSWGARAHKLTATNQPHPSLWPAHFHPPGRTPSPRRIRVCRLGSSPCAVRTRPFLRHRPLAVSVAVEGTQPA